MDIQRQKPTSKQKVDLNLTSYIKINLKWVEELNARPETIKLLQDNSR